MSKACTSLAKWLTLPVGSVALTSSGRGVAAGQLGKWFKMFSHNKVCTLNGKFVHKYILE